MRSPTPRSDMARMISSYSSNSTLTAASETTSEPGSGKGLRPSFRHMYSERAATDSLRRSTELCSKTGVVALGGLSLYALQLLCSTRIRSMTNCTVLN